MRPWQKEKLPPSRRGPTTRASAHPARAKTKTPRPVARGVERVGAGRRAYFAKTYFAARALARLAAFLCTTPDFTALSIAEA